MLLYQWSIVHRLFEWISKTLYKKIYSGIWNQWIIHLGRSFYSDIAIDVSVAVLEVK